MREKANQPSLSLFSLIMITVTSVDSIRNLTTAALFGSNLIFFYVIGAILFLIPVALVTTELAAAWPEQGGIYYWTKKAFGTKWAFSAVWFQWIANVVWYPATLSFLASILAYLIDPELINNRFYLLGVILIVYWIMVIVSLKGLKIANTINTICGLVGLFLPMILIILLGFFWLLSNKPLQISFNLNNMFPNLSDPSTLVSMNGILLSYMGIEIATAYAGFVQNPQRIFLRALVISTIIIFATLTLGSLSIAMVVPLEKLNLASGIMQAFSDFLSAYQIAWMLPFTGGCIIFGVIANCSNWMLALLTNLLVALKDLEFPQFFVKINHAGSPSFLIILQGIIVSVVSTIFIFLPTVNSSYWLLTIIASQAYLIMYMIIFFVGICLRYKYPNEIRPFKIPGKKFGLFLVTGAGLLMAFFTLIIGFFPPPDIIIVNAWEYKVSIIGGLALMSVPAILIYQLNQFEKRPKRNIFSFNNS